MRYETIDEELIAQFPELARAKACLDREWGNEKPGQYILFEDIFKHYVSYLLAGPPSRSRDERLRCIFGFLESMLSSCEADIRDLGFISLLEGQPEAWLQLAKPYIGPEAEAALDDVDMTWRERSLLNPSNLNVDNLIDLYGVLEVANTVLRNDGAT